MKKKKHKESTSCPSVTNNLLICLLLSNSISSDRHSAELPVIIILNRKIHNLEEVEMAQWMRNGSPLPRPAAELMDDPSTVVITLRLWLQGANQNAYVQGPTLTWIFYQNNHFNRKELAEKERMDKHQIKCIFCLVFNVTISSFFRRVKGGVAIFCGIVCSLCIHITHSLFSFRLCQMSSS